MLAACVRIVFAVLYNKIEQSKQPAVEQKTFFFRFVEDDQFVHQLTDLFLVHGFKIPGQLIKKNCQFSRNFKLEKGGFERQITVADIPAACQQKMIGKNTERFAVEVGGQSILQKIFNFKILCSPLG